MYYVALNRPAPESDLPMFRHTTMHVVILPVVPAVLLLIAVLLYFNFRNVVEVGIVLVTLPFPLLGGLCSVPPPVQAIGSRGCRIHCARWRGGRIWGGHALVS